MRLLDMGKMIMEIMKRGGKPIRSSRLRSGLAIFNNNVPGRVIQMKIIVEPRPSQLISTIHHRS